MNKYYLVCEDNESLNIANLLINFTKQITLINSNTFTYNNPYLKLYKTDLFIMFKEYKPINIKELFIKNLNKKNMLLKAIKSHQNTTIIDLTAGLGLDAFNIALNGSQVIMLEQDPLLATVLFYAIYLNIFPNDSKIIFDDSKNYLSITKFNFNNTVIYIDPMFNKNSTAKAKKTMQIIQNLNKNKQKYTDEEILLKLALTANPNKIVVKRDIHQKPIQNVRQPTYSLSGKLIRFDIYQL